ncbi:MAG TPA: hypothetical protein VFU48_06500 [Nitrospira sp.]|nr:hypothetical protein [Nitrospira sp.]
MTWMISDKSNVMPAMVIRAAVSLCMVAMIVGCSSGRDSNSRATATDISADGQPCLTQEQKFAKMKELSNKESFWQKQKEGLIIRGGGNLLGSLVGLGNAGEYADMANGVKKATVKGNAGRDSIDTIRTKDCDSEAPSTTNDAPAVK